jgi:hypothetical protein
VKKKREREREKRRENEGVVRDITFLRVDDWYFTRSEGFQAMPVRSSGKGMIQKWKRWEAASRSASQEIHCLFWYPKSLLFSQGPVNGPYPEPHKCNPYLPPNIHNITLILPSHLRLGLPNGLFPSRFPTIIFYSFLISTMRAAYNSMQKLM